MTWRFRRATCRSNPRREDGGDFFGGTADTYLWSGGQIVADGVEGFGMMANGAQIMLRAGNENNMMMKY